METTAQPPARSRRVGRGGPRGSWPRAAGRAEPHALRRLGRARLAKFIWRCSHRAPDPARRPGPGRRAIAANLARLHIPAVAVTTQVSVLPVDEADPPNPRR
jgi:hypothetical protein